MNFTVTDNALRVHAQYCGFLGEEVLAKHDENYMPPESAYALKKGNTANQAAGVTGANLTKEVK